MNIREIRLDALRGKTLPLDDLVPILEEAEDMESELETRDEEISALKDQIEEVKEALEEDDKAAEIVRLNHFIDKQQKELARLGNEVNTLREERRNSFDPLRSKRFIEAARLILEGKTIAARRDAFFTFQKLIS